MSELEAAKPAHADVAGDDNTAESSGKEKGVFTVAIYGLLGGLVLWVWELLEGEAKWDDWLSILTPLGYMALGSTSAVVSVFLFFGPDRRDVPRIVALALLSGFTFAWVFEGGFATLLQHNAERQDKTAVVNAVASATGIRATKDPQSRGSESGPEPDDGVHRDVDEEGEDLAEAFERMLRVLADTQDRELEDVVEMTIGDEVVTVDGGRIERKFTVDTQGQDVKMAAFPLESQQDLMAVLFEVRDDGLLRVVDFNDDSGLGSVNPRVTAALESGEYLARILPYDDEPIGKVKLSFDLVVDGPQLGPPN